MQTKDKDLGASAASGTALSPSGSSREGVSSASPLQSTDARNWLVWSNEHRAFWRPNRCGYAGRIEQAGRYTKAAAEAICRGANPRANSTIYEGEPPEICMPAPEALEPMADLYEAIETWLADFDDDRRDLQLELDHAARFRVALARARGDTRGIQP